MNFQVFQLTTLLIRGSATSGKKFFVILDRLAISEEEMRGVLLCVQDFVRSPSFTKRSLFSESGVTTMLSESVSIADSITSGAVYALWNFVETACAGQVIIDLHACWDRLVLRLRTAKDTTEPWYYGGAPQSETASRPGVRIPVVNEEGRVEYVPVAAPALGPPGSSKIRSSISEWKRKSARNTAKLPRRFEISRPPSSPQRQSDNRL